MNMNEIKINTPVKTGREYTRKKEKQKASENLAKPAKLDPKPGKH